MQGLEYSLIKPKKFDRDTSYNPKLISSEPTCLIAPPRIGCGKDICGGANLEKARLQPASIKFQPLSSSPTANHPHYHLSRSSIRHASTLGLGLGCLLLHPSPIGPFGRFIKASLPPSHA